MAAGLLLAMLVGGCDGPGDRVEVEVGKKYKPASTDVVNRHGKIENLEQLRCFLKMSKTGKKTMSEL
jgi:hypothetical protein